MSKFDSHTEWTARICEKQQSPEYQQACRHFQSECDRLAQAFSQLPIQEWMQACQKNTVRTEWAVGSTLHRGFYCPSPVYDLLVGNVKRGVIRKNGIPVENRSHVYGFDEAGRLLWCKSLYNAKAAYTEYLTYCDSRIFGVTVSEQGEVMSLTEEVYAEGRIVSYLYGLCLNPEGTVKIAELSCEYYTYDEEGLCGTQWHRYIHADTEGSFSGKKPLWMQQPFYRTDSYRFVRKNGYLDSYTNGISTYKVRSRRKA